MEDILLSKRQFKTLRKEGLFVKKDEKHKHWLMRDPWSGRFFRIHIWEPKISHWKLKKQSAEVVEWLKGLDCSAKIKD